MNAWMAFVSIIAIVAIVLIAGGLIALIGHMIIGAFDNDKNPTSNKEVLDYNQYTQIENTKSNEVTDEFDFDAIDKAKAEKEEALIEKEEEDDVFKLVEEEDADIEEIEQRLKQANEEKQEVVDEATVEDDDDLDIDGMLDEISNDIIEEEKEKIDEEVTKMSDQLTAYNIDDILAQVEEDEESEEGSEEPVEESDESDEEPMEIRPEVEEEKDTRLDSAKEEIEALKAQLAELNKQLDEAKNNKVEVVSINMTEEECVNRLEVLEERLKNVKKEYKINMKEYRPLKKIMNDMEKYQTKLRRKENVVAKKKVALYGVNNYVDIDKEKAEKLAKEIELWEGLRLSVSHCEDVINANKDRYPILEHTNKILEDQIAHIEADIATTQETLKKIREQNGESDSEIAE